MMDENQLNEMFFNIMEVQQEDRNEIEQYLQSNNLVVLLEQQPKLQISEETTGKLKLLAEMIAFREAL
ncbi:hypothetical protein [Anaerocolumna chitinilytica]|uniref:Uncharacterized protein n=1 Tax=Anaerocolumna chitinilytica TaxID=1727145 RepID=A0A7I8DIY0_9FIRM|nr:hypothetical protein [Anaerocolumna chitinilytica]BCJ98413.1 hypothetical protein bsdcttw_14540 [Anaerocolumna chitinilytica]